MYGKGRVKWAKKQVPSVLEQLFLCSFDERSELGKPKVFRVSAQVRRIAKWQNDCLQSILTDYQSLFYKLDDRAKPSESNAHCGRKRACQGNCFFAHLTSEANSENQRFFESLPKYAILQDGKMTACSQF